MAVIWSTDENSWFSFHVFTTVDTDNAATEQGFPIDLKRIRLTPGVRGVQDYHITTQRMYHVGGATLSLEIGDITTSKEDALVGSGDFSLTMGCDVSAALQRSDGQAILLSDRWTSIYDNISIGDLWGQSWIVEGTVVHRLHEGGISRCFPLIVKNQTKILLCRRI